MFLLNKKVNGLPLPTALVEVIEQGRWREPWDFSRFDDILLRPEDVAAWEDVSNRDRWKTFPNVVNGKMGVCCNDPTKGRVLRMVHGLHDDVGVARYGRNLEALNRLFPHLEPIPNIDFLSIKRMRFNTPRCFHENLGEPLDGDAPGDIDPRLAVLIAFHSEDGVGSDLSLFLDYRPSLEHPAVVANHFELTEARDRADERGDRRTGYRGPHYRTVAPDIEAFIEAMHL